MGSRSEKVHQEACEVLDLMASLYTREKEFASRDVVNMNMVSTSVQLLFIVKTLNSMCCVFNLSLLICFQQEQSRAY